MTRKAALPRSTYRPAKPSRSAVRREPKTTSALSSISRTFWLVISLLFVLVVSMGGIFSVLISQIEPLQETTRVLLISQDKESRHHRPVLVYFLPAQKQARVISFNPEVSMSVLGGYGQYNLATVVPFLTIEKKSPTYIQAALSQGLGWAIDQVAHTSTPETVDNVTKLRKLLLTHVKSHPTQFKEGLRWYFFSQQLTPADMTFSQVESEAEWQKLREKLAKLDVQAGCPVSVINTTPTSGLASQMGQWLESSGAVVIKLSDSQEPQPETELFIQPGSNCQLVLRAIQDLLPMKLEMKEDPQLTAQYRSSAVLLIGTDLAEIAQP